MSKCDYCGEERELLETIMNPNMDDNPANWNVCIICREVIDWQKQLTFGQFIAGMDDAFSKDYGQKRMKEAQENLDRIAREQKIPIMSATIYKTKEGYDSMSVEYTGKGGKDDV